MSGSSFSALILQVAIVVFDQVLRSTVEDPQPCPAASEALVVQIEYTGWSDVVLSGVACIELGVALWWWRSNEQRCGCCRRRTPPSADRISTLRMQGLGRDLGGSGRAQRPLVNYGRAVGHDARVGAPPVVLRLPDLD